MGRDLARLIYEPWIEIRRRVTGSTAKPLHASGFSRIAKQGDMEAVAEFFRVHPFFRIGAIISINTKLANDMSPLQFVQGRQNYI
jgi:hypothetical protein